MKNLNIDMEQITSTIEDFIQLSEEDQREIRGRILYKRLLKIAKMHTKTEEAAKERLRKSIQMATEIDKFTDEQKSEFFRILKEKGIDFNVEDEDELEKVELNIKFKNNQE